MVLLNSGEENFKINLIDRYFGLYTCKSPIKIDDLNSN